MISIIMPNYNGERHIEKSINSFLDLNYSKKELVIIDGKSIDGSHSIIESYVDRYPSVIQWCKQSDVGISDAINKGISLASGNIIGYLGSDDLLNKDTLDVVNQYKKLVDFDAIYFDSYTYYIDKGNIVLRKCPNIEFNKRNLIKFGTIVGLQNIFFDKRVYAECSYNIDNKYSMDYEIYFQVVNSFSNFLYVEYPATINLFSDNITNKLSKEQHKEAVAVMFKNVKGFEYRFLPLKRCVITLLGL